MAADPPEERSAGRRADNPPDEAYQLVPDPNSEGLEPYEVFVQWERGDPHEHAETIDAPSEEMAAMLAKRNIDVRSEPLSIWVTPRRAVIRTRGDDPTLVPSTDRSYRSPQWYAEHQIEVDTERSKRPADAGDTPQEGG